MHRKRVLVVDDEVYIVHILEFSLSMEGYEVVTASTGEEALRKMRETPPDLIVLDVMMPGMDGYQVCEEVRKDPSLCDVPILMLSAKGRAVDRDLGLDHGADQYIVKPFSPRDLLERIREMLEGSTIDEASNF